MKNIRDSVWPPNFDSYKEIYLKVYNKFFSLLLKNCLLKIRVVTNATGKNMIGFIVFKDITPYTYINDIVKMILILQFVPEL